MVDVSEIPSTTPCFTRHPTLTPAKRYDLDLFRGALWALLNSIINFTRFTIQGRRRFVCAYVYRNLQRFTVLLPVDD